MSSPTPAEVKYNGLVYKALELHGAGPEILSLIGSWKETLDDDEVVDLLSELLSFGDTLQGEIQ
ncbi:MAG: hypothetical protein JKY52_08425 [Flavobacteriales bacterium]|nr:hypothetical protein [Flavobacteriales bacterium]